MGDVLMELLPNRDWRELVTQQDIKNLQTDVNAHLVRVESKLDNLTRVLEAMERRITFAINAGLVVIVAFAGALWQLK